MSWTHEEQMVIDQAVEDLASQATDHRVQAAQAAVQEALKRFGGQAPNTMSLQNIRKMASEVLDKASGTKDSYDIVVELDPNDPTVVAVKINYRPVTKQPWVRLTLERSK